MFLGDFPGNASGRQHAQLWIDGYLSVGSAVHIVEGPRSSVGHDFVEATFYPGHILQLPHTFKMHKVVHQCPVTAL